MLKEKSHIFEAVVEAGSISKAAENLTCSRKVISYAIEDMERKAGVPLIEKVSSGIQLTKALFLF